MPRTSGRLLHDFNREFEEPTPRPALSTKASVSTTAGGRADGPANYFYERRL